MSLFPMLNRELAVRFGRQVLCVFTLCAGMLDATRVGAAEFAVLTPETWDAWAPSGKEVDCIYGDVVVRNDHLVAVIAQPIVGRNANMTVRNVGGSIIDLSSREANNDQLSAYYPGAASFPLETVESGQPQVANGKFSYTVRSEETSEKATLEVTYELGDDPWLTVRTTYSNPHDQTIRVAPKDSARADRSFKFDLKSTERLFTASDEWWHHAFAAMFEHVMPMAAGDTVERGRPVLSLSTDGATLSFELEPGENRVITRRLLTADNQWSLYARVAQLRGIAFQPVQINVNDPAGAVYNALVEVSVEDDTLLGRTNRLGQLHGGLPPGSYHVKITANGRPSVTQKLEVGRGTDGQLEVELEAAGYVRGTITDPQGRRIPCKVEFQPAGDTKPPFFGPDTYAESLHNLVYTANGQFRQAIAPGQYNVLISHGPEFDAVRQSIEVLRGQDTIVQATLVRSVDTQGWISSDFHSHSSPSGDNVSEQSGRVLNLLAEHIEFGPCTEHNRISSYVPHLEKYGATHLMATCSGMELTGRPLPVNHQNAFPLKRRPRTQDGGGPTTDENPVVQIERLAFWDRRSQKVVQVNHPNLMQILGDRDTDGKPDDGFERMLGAMDVVEVHPPAKIFNFPIEPPPPRERPNVIYNWLQLLNQGYRIPGVVNTDAHYNFHGSGWLRNYIKSETDDPNQITIANMIRSSEQGNVVMTNGPYLEVTASAGENKIASPGDDLVTQDGAVTFNIKIQCANWLDVNRVQLFLNGRPSEKHNFRRATHSNLFRGGTVKFEHRIALDLDTDTHVIVATIGQGLQLGPVVGPERADDEPVAVANPIYVDVGADGFQPNGDSLGLKLPVEE